MIDLTRIEDYRENNRIEAKLALGGLPKSIWETYSSFANTLGGIILLGVEELKDKSLRPVDLPDPGRLVARFRALLADRKIVSADILGEDGVKIEVAEGKRIVVITVPRAPRKLRPVYIGGDPFAGTYRRSGEGDYRCTGEEVAAMLRDAQGVSPDSAVTGLPLSALDSGSIAAYRMLVKGGQIGALPHADFLRAVGAAAESGNGLRPTLAGLLMFGTNADICASFKYYFLEYREIPARRDGAEPPPDEPVPPLYCISSDSGLACGNIFGFYSAVRARFAGSADEEVSAALCEALVNCLCNADYHGRKGVIILKKSGGYVFSNPGIFRTDIASAAEGGLSDPRNRLLSRMFALAGLKADRGGGIASIFSLWESRGWARPVIREGFAPERTTLTLTFSPAKERRARGYGRDTALAAAIIGYLTDNILADIPAMAEALGRSRADVKRCVRALLESGVVVPKDGGYSLKS